MMGSSPSRYLCHLSYFSLKTNLMFMFCCLKLLKASLVSRNSSPDKTLVVLGASGNLSLIISWFPEQASFLHASVTMQTCGAGDPTLASLSDLPVDSFSFFEAEFNISSVEAPHHPFGSPLRGTLASSLRYPAEGEGNEVFPPPPEKDLESPS